MSAGLGSGEEVTSKFIQVVGKIQLLAAVRLKCLFPWGLSPRRHCLLPEAALLSLHVTPFIFKLAKVHQVLLTFSVSLIPPLALSQIKL